MAQDVLCFGIKLDGLAIKSLLERMPDQRLVLPHCVALIGRAMPAADLRQSPELEERTFRKLHLGVARIRRWRIHVDGNSAFEGVLEFIGRREVEPAFLQGRKKAIEAKIFPECLIALYGLANLAHAPSKV
jgi:hypothetical protein